MRFLGAGDAEILLDLRGVGDSDVEAKAGGCQSPGARHSDLYEVPTCNGRQSSLSHPTNGRRTVTLSQAWTRVKFQPVECGSKAILSGVMRKAILSPYEGQHRVEQG